MTSPISSPQNLIAVNTIISTSWNVTSGNSTSIVFGNIGWGSWLGASLPFAFLCTLVAWGLLWVVYRPAIKEVDPVPPKQLEPFGVAHMFVLIVSLTTILLWALGSRVNGVFGNPGIVGLIPVVCFFTFPILPKTDFKKLSWEVLMLLAGGLALGNAIESSGLLAIIANSIADLVKDSNEWTVLMTFATFIWVFGNFISHTVAAIIVLPVVAKVGCQMGAGNCMAGHYRLLILGSVFMDSGAMSLPVASFPNAQAFSLLDKDGNRYLSTMDFLKNGIMLGILESLLLMSVGYGLLHTVVQ